MIAAIYARKSTDQNVADEEKSVTRQVERARAYATRKGWTVDEAHVYIDDGDLGRGVPQAPGVPPAHERAQAAAPFQVLIMCRGSRLGREQIETAYALKQLITAGVRVCAYLEDRERTLDSPTDEAPAVRGRRSPTRWSATRPASAPTDAMSARRGRGHVTGGRVFGYDNVRDPRRQGRRQHVVRRVIEAEAAVVRRIFERCAEGAGLGPSRTS